MSDQTYFKQLKVYAEKYIKGFIDDFYEIDQSNLHGYSGDLIWAVRPCGTSMMLFNESDGWWSYQGYKQDLQKPGPKGYESMYHYKAGLMRREQLDFFNAWVLEKNDHFYIGQKGKVKSVDLAEAREFARKHINFNSKVFC